MLALFLVGSVALSGGWVGATTVVYNDFSNLSGMQLNGVASGASSADGSVLRLTNALWQSGSAFSKTPIALQNDSSFSTYFRFRISNPQGWSDDDGQGADGIVFVVQTVANNLGGEGGGIGYQNIPKSVGIEFDTWNNGGWDDNSGNHVGIDLNGNIDSAVQTQTFTPRMNNGEIWYAWVDYNGVSDLMEVRLGGSGSRPTSALLSYTVDLAGSGYLGSPNAYIGFTSGTGAAGGYHDILSWKFEDTYKPITTPEPSVLSLLFMGLAGIGLISRKNRG